MLKFCMLGPAGTRNGLCRRDCLCPPRPHLLKAPIDDYHVYGLIWDEDEIEFYVDGVLARREPNTHGHLPLTLSLDGETMAEWFGLPGDGAPLSLQRRVCPCMEARPLT
ncbi:MAG: family 16 glycosylhydrolase [Candidatus Hydrogenedentes bacterium]|nr:family 16 glycosylhydrolase [Candidatus Hydrogenedentota bacterium]